jgi:archaetidylinositol phosphate synthase
MNFSSGRRVRSSVLAEPETQTLNWLCERLPSNVLPDHLTAVGIAGAFITFCSYIASYHNSAFLWVASFGLVLNWFGDSLDGSLARYRHQEKLRYGYFLDCMTDAFCCLLVMAGLGFSSFVRMDVALFSAIGYYMLCIYVFLNHHVTGIHKLSFGPLGPTEMRLGLISLNIWMFAQGQIKFMIAGQAASIYDLVLIGNGVLSVAVFVRLLMRGIEGLREQEIVGMVAGTSQRQDEIA